MEELDIALITKRSIRGMVTLMSRSVFIQAANFGTFIVLTLILSPAVIGIYNLSTIALTFLTYFSDIGLAAALVQKKENITDEEVNSTFYLQQLLVIFAVAIALLIGGFIKNFYGFTDDGLLLYYVLIFSFFISSLKTIPSIFLERVLRFDVLVIPQIVETIAFDVVAVSLALTGWGIKSFVVAIIVRDVAGLVTMYCIRPWFPKRIFSFSAAKHLLSFGVPFQMNSFLALLKDSLLMLVLGKILPLSAIGYITFAQKWAFTPLRLIMDNVIKITFASYSRLQHEEAHLAKALEKSLFALVFLIFPALVGLVLIAPWVIIAVPKYAKWEPALLSLGFFALNAAASSISTPLTNILNATGKLKISLNLMVFWTVTTWILTLPLVLIYGFNGVAAASGVIAATSVFLVVNITKKYIPFSITHPIKYPFIATVIMGIALYGLKLFLPINWITIVILILVGTGIYFSTLYLMAKEQLLEDIKLIERQFIK